MLCNCKSNSRRELKRHCHASFQSNLICTSSPWMPFLSARASEGLFNHQLLRPTLEIPPELLAPPSYAGLKQKSLHVVDVHADGAAGGICSEWGKTYFEESEMLREVERCLAERTVYTSCCSFLSCCHGTNMQKTLTHIVRLCVLLRYIVVHLMQVRKRIKKKYIYSMKTRNAILYLWDK